MAKRVFHIAKELGVASKAVVAKCHAEGIPQDVIKNHMSTVSVGLEATIREWFSEEAEQHSAVETTEKVDLQKVRVKKKTKSAGKKAADHDQGDDAGGHVGVATAQPAEETSAVPTMPKAKPIKVTKVTPAATTETAKPETSPKDTDAGSAVEPDKKPSSPVAPAPTKQTAPPAAATQTETTSTDTDEGGLSDGERKKATPAAKASKPTLPPTPAPMNVPSRPKVVAPAGPRLEDAEKEKVKLSGPKVVRIEAPDVIAPPRRSRDIDFLPSYGGGGVPGGGGPSPRGKGRRRDGSVPSRRRGHSGSEMRGGKFTEQDLAEREARLQRSGGYLKMRRQQAKRAQQSELSTPAVKGGKVKITEPFTIKDLSAATGVKAADIVKALFMQGIMSTINSGIDTEKAQEIMMDWDIELEVVEAKTAEQQVSEAFDKREVVDERPRGPVVTIMGHVDHGKTSLLDRIRNANVAKGEAGGITQATSAFRVPVKLGDDTKHIVFIDTPGHQAFTEMRSRGANVTDIVVLVVAADDGVMPQTIESINHAQAAGVPIVVALNKCDKPEATESNIQRILGQLAEHGLNSTEWGGDVEVIKTSAATGEGIDDLLETLDLQAQVLELKADFGGPARGTVIESRFVPGRGAVANVLVQEGELKVGNFIVAGRAFGRVRDIIDDRNNRVKSVVPPSPVQISGIDEIPNAGDHFYIVDTLKKAQHAAEQRRQRDREAQLAQPKVTLSSLFNDIASQDVKEILIVLKADVQGSVDVLRNEIQGISTDEVKVRVLHAAVGGITESDVILAEASSAIIVGFNVIPSSKARSMAEQKHVEIRTYDVIYHITEDITKAAEGLLEPELRQEVLGHAEVRQVFKVSKVGAIAGCYVTDGHIERDALIRVTRGDIVIENDRKLEQLKRFKDDVKEVRSGMECGMKIAGYDDIKQGDILECYKNIEVKRTLS